jgi:hypothetical protein
MAENVKLIITGLFFLVLATGFVSAQDSDTVTIDINITQVISIDVSPNSVSWIGLSVGETGTPEYFTVTNVGSVNVTDLRANITNDDTNPYGTGTSANYDAGEFILMNTTSAGFFYVNKKNWNESVPGDVIVPTDFTEGADTGYFGILRTAGDNDVGQDYYYFTNRTDSSGDCLSASSVLLLGVEPKNVSDAGDVDFTDSGNYSTVTFAAGNNGANGPAGHDFANYCFLISDDCSTITMTHWNTDLDSGTNCTADVSFYTGSDLEPGSFTSFYLEPKIPNGVPDGDASQGTLTIIASAS